MTREVKVTEIDGTVRIFPSVKETALYYSMSSTAISDRINGNTKNDPRKFEYTGRILTDCRVKRSRKDEEDHTPERKEREEIHYETIGTRLCVTVCKYKTNAGVKVGSVLCQGCGRFKGINREKHIVICG